MNITLIGLGTGKTAIASLLARSLGKKLISTDEEIEKRAKLSISKFIKKYGLNRFREIETEAIENISDFDECVFDAGEGAVMRNENIINFKKNGLIILLISDTKKMTKIDRKEINILQEYEARCKKAADYTIDASDLSPEEACSLITHYVQMELQ